MKYSTLHMCDFCARDYPDCGASPILSRDMEVNGEAHKHKKIVSNEDAVVACNNYESPIDVLKRKFH